MHTTQYLCYLCAYDKELAAAGGIVLISNNLIISKYTKKLYYYVRFKITTTMWHSNQGRIGPLGYQETSRWAGYHEGRYGRSQFLIFT